LPPADKPRLLYLITLASAGGAQTYVGLLLFGTRERYEVALAARAPGFLVDESERLGVPFYPLRHLRREVQPFRDVLALIELVRLFRRYRPDVLHVNSSKAGILGRLAAVIARVPTRIFTVHGWAYSVEKGPLRRVYLVLERLLARATSLVICVSHDDLRLGLAKKTCVPERSTVIWNAVDVEAAPKATHSSEQPVIVSVGRLQAPQKDFRTLIRALALLPEGSFRALVVGEGPDLDQLVRETSDLGVHNAVEFLGHRGDVPEVLASADVFVLATTYESLPMSIIEAMAAGLPVVATATGGVPELVAEGETGLLVPPRDPEALAAALSRLVGSRDLRLAMGQRGLARARLHFDLRRFYAEHFEAYERFVRSGPARR
jgi:glycosyltransferase involved in cell wall biosynthesis